MAEFIDLDAITLAGLRQRQSLKYRVHDDDVIEAWVAEMDFPLAPPVAAALHAAIDRSDTGYRHGGDLPAALAEFAARRWGWVIPPANVTLVADVLSGLAWSLAALTEPGDGVVLTSPVYPPFFSTIRDVAHREVVDVPLIATADGALGLDLPGLAAAFARTEVRAFVLCSPHNPTGAVPTREELTVIAALAAEHDVLVIADEIHAPLTLLGATHTPYLAVAGEDAMAVSLVSASKAWNVAGLKCAQLVSTDRTRRPLATLPMEATSGTGHLGAIAAIAAYRDGEPWLDAALAIIDGNRWLLRELLAGQLPAVGYRPPAASYLAWLDFRPVGGGSDPAVPILERGRVALSSGVHFGPGGAGWARLNLATTPAILGEIVARVATVFQ